MKLDKYTVGKRYGKALFQLAIEENQAEEVYQDLLSLRVIYHNLPDLGNILSDVRLNSASKRTIMDILVSDFKSLVHNFLEVVYTYSRMDDVLLMIEEFERRYDDYQGLVLGTVTTAIPLNQDQQQVLETKIAKLLGYQTAKLTNQVDADILGGVIVEANHQVIDGSIATKLEQLKKMLNA